MTRTNDQAPTVPKKNVLCCGMLEPLVLANDRWMGQQPRADLEVRSGGRNCLRVVHPHLMSPQRSVHFEYRHTDRKTISPFGRPKKFSGAFGAPFSHICAKIHVTLPTCHSHLPLSMRHRVTDSPTPRQKTGPVLMPIPGKHPSNVARQRVLQTWDAVFHHCNPATTDESTLDDHWFGCPPDRVRPGAGALLECSCVLGV